MKLNVDQLYYFYVVAKLGSIKAATQKLHVTQPSISIQLKQLETFIGFKLFTRKPRKLEITERGRHLLEKLEKVFNLLEEIEHTLGEQPGKLRNSLRIGVTASLPHNFIDKFTLSSLKNPDIKTIIKSGDLQNLLKNLESDEIDIILSETPISRKKGLKILILQSENICAIGHKKFSGLRKRFPNSLSGAPIISFLDNTQIQNDLNYLFEVKGIKPEIIGEVQSYNLILNSLKKGLGIIFAPETEAKNLIKIPSIVNIGVIEGLTFNCHLTTTAIKYKNVIIRSLINKSLS